MELLWRPIWVLGIVRLELGIRLLVQLRLVWQWLGLELVELGTVVWPGMVVPVLGGLQLVGPDLDLVGLGACCRRLRTSILEGDLSLPFHF